MKTKFWATGLFLVFTLAAKAQWGIGAGIGPSYPITGYKEVVKPGMTIFDLNAKRYLGQGSLAVGAKVQMARFAKDKNPDDAFHDVKLTVAPVIFTADYTFNRSGKLQPYLTAGLGLSFFAVSYNQSPNTIDDESTFNVSFTMMPQIGFRYSASEHLFPFIEGGIVMIADGPPVGFPEGEKLTGYQFACLGLEYKF